MPSATNCIRLSAIAAYVTVAWRGDRFHAVPCHIWRYRRAILIVYIARVIVMRSPERSMMLCTSCLWVIIIAARLGWRMAKSIVMSDICCRHA
jgi:hypothetical protein